MISDDKKFIRVKKVYTHDGETITNIEFMTVKDFKLIKNDKFHGGGSPVEFPFKWWEIQRLFIIPSIYLSHFLFKNLHLKETTATMIVIKVAISLFEIIMTWYISKYILDKIFN